MSKLFASFHVKMKTWTFFYISWERQECSEMPEVDAVVSIKGKRNRKLIKL